MIDLSRYAAFYDDEIGAVWFPAKGIIKATDKNHAKYISEALTEIKEGRASLAETNEIISYLENESGQSKLKEFTPLEVKTLLYREGIQRLEIMVANDCNLSCKYCYAKAGTYGKKPLRMTPVEVVNYLRDFISVGYKFINSVMFFGGEPTLCPDTIKAACEYFEKLYADNAIIRVPIYTMVTNGTLLSDKMMDIIEKYHINVTISIDGPKDITDYLRINKAGEGVYDTVAKAIRTMNERQIKIRMAEATYTTKHMELGYNRQDIKSYITKELGIADSIVSNCEPNGSDDSLAVDEDLNNVRTDFNSWKKIIYRLEGRQCSDIGCESGFGSVSMAPNGDLYPCHYFTFNESFVIARFKEGKYDYSEYDKFQKLFENAHHLKNPSCHDCWAKYTCNMCPANLFIHDMSGCEVRLAMQKKIILKYVKEHIVESDGATA